MCAVVGCVRMELQYEMTSETTGATEGKLTLIDPSFGPFGDDIANLNIKVQHQPSLYEGPNWPM